MRDYWEENGIEKPQRIIVAAANKLDGTSLILVGARHWDDIMREQYYAAFPHSRKPHSALWIQGFIDQFGDFINREEALAIAKASGQPLNMERNGSTKELYSEGLY